MFNLSRKKTIFVAMSGGVDSSVAAAFLRKQGHTVIGVTMCLSVKGVQGGQASCCGPDAIHDAKAAAETLKIPHYILNFGTDIEEDVITPFIEAYASGRTPNPCVQCNQRIKFTTLLSKAKAMGADALATGHYARIERRLFTKQYELKKGRDRQKDQSYFLYAIKKEALADILFPLGGLTKARVRRIARSLGLPNADKEESQDICFVPGGDYRQLLEARLGKDRLVPGPIKDENGKVLGEHKGIACYTIGQRDGLGIAVGKPLYIFKIDASTNTIYVGEKARLLSRGLIAADVNFVSMDLPKKEIEVGVKIRYNHPEMRARVRPLNRGRLEVIFARPDTAVTPGQSVVFYRRDVLLGGGTITEAIS